MKLRKRPDTVSLAEIDHSLQYRQLFEHSLGPGAILSPVLDMNGRLVDVVLVDANEAFCQAAGIACEKVRGRLTRHFLPVLENRIAPLQAFLQDAAEVLKTGQPRTRDIFLARQNRHYRYRIFALDNNLAAVTAVEIAPPNSEEPLEKIQHKIIEMREVDRQQTANYLHEGLLQALIGIRYAIEEGLGIEQKETRMAKLAAVQANLQREIQSLRDYCNELRPPTLAQFGLEKTIRAYVETYQKKHARPAVTLALTADRQLVPGPHRLALFRAFQELFIRFSKDPNVQALFVQFSLDESNAILEITYDGAMPEQGLDWADWTALAQQGQIGLASALGWVEGLGGRTEIQPAAENRQKVRILIPVNS